MQTRREYLFDLGIRKFGAELPQTLLRWIGEGFQRGAGYRVQ